MERKLSKIIRKGAQANFVFRKWTHDQLGILKPGIELAAAIKDFGLMGIDKTVNVYNGKCKSIIAGVKERIISLYKATFFENYVLLS